MFRKKKEKKKTMSLAKDPVFDVQWKCKHPDLNDSMREILFDWLFDVYLKFKVRKETMSYCFLYIDMFLKETAHFERKKFQLLGVTCLWIASKLFDTYAVDARDLVYITDKGCTKKEIIDFEIKVVEALQGKFYNHVSLVTRVEQLNDVKDEKQVHFYAALCPQYSHMHAFSYTEIAQAANRLSQNFPAETECEKQLDLLVKGISEKTEKNAVIKHYQKK
jgi:hypothetical protein